MRLLIFFIAMPLIAIICKTAELEFQAIVVVALALIIDALDDIVRNTKKKEGSK